MGKFGLLCISEVDSPPTPVRLKRSCCCGDALHDSRCLHSHLIQLLFRQGRRVVLAGDGMPIIYGTFGMSLAPRPLAPLTTTSSANVGFNLKLAYFSTMLPLDLKSITVKDSSPLHGHARELRASSTNSYVNMHKDRCVDGTEATRSHLRRLAHTYEETALVPTWTSRSQRSLSTHTFPKRTLNIRIRSWSFKAKINVTQTPSVPANIIANGVVVSLVTRDGTVLDTVTYDAASCRAKAAKNVTRSVRCTVKTGQTPMGRLSMQYWKTSRNVLNGAVYSVMGTWHKRAIDGAAAVAGVPLGVTITVPQGAVFGSM